MWFRIFVGGIATYIVYSYINDIEIRDKNYTKPLGNMPANANKLAETIVDQGSKELGGVTGEELRQLKIDAFKLLAEGAVEQRNLEMKKVREQISYLFLAVSYIMKQKGLSYDELEAKFAMKFPDCEIKKFQAIIESAARSNPNLFNKAYHTILNFLTPAQGRPDARPSNSVARL
jgi:hypothetical protein